MPMRLCDLGLGGLVVCQGKGKPTSSEHCKQLEKLLMLTSGFVSLLTSSQLTLVYSSVSHYLTLAFELKTADQRF